MQPRQIYASTLARRDRRWTGGRGRTPRSAALLSAATLVGALGVLAATYVPGLA